MCFEDDFMSIQADYVSLCLELIELTKYDVDKIYIFIYQDSDVQTFNAFFKKDDVIKKAMDFGSDDLIDEFLEIGIEDINRLIEVCDKHKQKCPNEIRIIYEVHSKKFKANYAYEDYELTSDKNSDEVLFNWIKEVSKEK